MGLWQVIHSNRREGREKRRLSTLYTIWVLFHNGRSLHLLFIKLQALKEPEVSVLMTQLQSFLQKHHLTFLGFGLAAEKWKVSLNLKSGIEFKFVWLTNKMFFMHWLYHVLPWYRRKTYMALCLSFVTLHKTWNLLEVLYSKLKWS